jgi:GSH-dependent disulfide-bond oxidoreductase
MIKILAADTANGVKIPIPAGDLGPDYRITPVNLARGEQRTPAFLAVNPNSRTPAVIDNAPPGGGAPVSIFESGAMRVRAPECLFLQAAGLGPSFSQAARLLRAAPERLPYAIARFRGEARRHLDLLDTRLGDATWLPGAEFPIADIAHFGWMRRTAYAGIETVGLPHLERWFAAVAARPALLRGIAAVQGA